MELELEIIDSLQALTYDGKCLQNDAFTAAIDGGTRSSEFREVVGWLGHQLHILLKTDEMVSAGTEEPSEFAMELSAMLKELGCPYAQFVTGPLSSRFDTRESRLLLMEYLVTELMATKMVRYLRPEQKSYVIPKFETNTARALVQLTKDLSLGKPPEKIAPRALFDKINFKVEEQLRQVNPLVISEPLLKTPKPLSDDQWQKLQAIHESLDDEYNLRREMLLTRLEVTIQSFQWSDKMKNRENEINERFQKKMKEMESLKQGGDDTNIVALLAARTDLAVIEKTSSANVRKNTGSKIQKHIIGNVPDRGGRANEHAPPPPEMPPWQKQRVAGPPGGGRGGGGQYRGGRGGGGGGRGGGGRGGGGGGRGGQWHQQQQQQQHQRYDQRVQFDQNQQNWMAGSGRVQGSGWSQAGGGGHNYQDNLGGGDYRQDNRQHFGGGGGGRGTSNYNRGGGYRR